MKELIILEGSGQSAQSSKNPNLNNILSLKGRVMNVGFDYSGETVPTEQVNEFIDILEYLSGRLATEKSFALKPFNEMMNIKVSLNREKFLNVSSIRFVKYLEQIENNLNTYINKTDNLIMKKEVHKIVHEKIVPLKIMFSI